MTRIMMNLNEISYNIRKACFEIHNKLGLGLLESVYEAVLANDRDRTKIFDSR